MCSTMLKELTKSEWLSLLSIPESKVPQVLVLRGTRNLSLLSEAVVTQRAG